MTTITRLFDSRSDAESAVRRLESMGIDHDNLSIVSHGGDARGEDRSFLNRDADGDGESDVKEGAEKGATTGGVIGAGAGLLAGLGMLAIPGLGPVVAAGWLASTAVGAATGALAGGATGGLLGALKDAGVDDDDANVYAEGVRRGGTLVAVRTTDANRAEVEQVLNEHTGIDARTRGQVYRQEGWTRFDDSAAAADRPMGGI